MRWVALLLLFANLGLAAYLGLVAPGRRGIHDPRALELNADRVQRVHDAPAPAKLDAGACLEWGPFAGAELARAQEQLASLPLTKTAVRESPGTPVWWVHIPPARSREEAERRVRELEALGVQDARVVTDDAYRNAVSLGIFRSEAAAAEQQARLREIKVRNAAVVQRSDLLKFSTIVVFQPTTAAAAKLVELRQAFAGSEVKAAACPAAGG
jgi:hypothetical protein